MKEKTPDFAQYHVGVFDSGRGGRYVAESLTEILPGLRLSVFSDEKNIPYGRKTPAGMLACAKPFMDHFNALEVDAVVMACNTCFTNLEADLRELLDSPLLGFEPALKEAVAASQSRTVVVCATQGTLESRRWREMKAAQPGDLTIIDIDCSDWVALVESGEIGEKQLKPVVRTAVEAGADSLVLGCTHYHCLKRQLLSLVPEGYGLELYEPTVRVAGELRRLLTSGS